MSTQALANIKQLQEAGFTKPQVIALIDLQEKTVNITNTHAATTMAIKVELSEARLENVMKDLIMGVLKETQMFRTEIYSEIQCFRGELQGFKQELQGFKTELQWVKGELQVFRGELKNFKEQLQTLTNKVITLEVDVAKLKADVSLIKGLCIFMVGFVTIVSGYPVLVDLFKHFF